MYVKPGNENQQSIGQYFGHDGYGFSQIPPKSSNFRLSRFLYEDKRGHYWGFPHHNGFFHGRDKKDQRTWKKHRNKQWKEMGFPLIASREAPLSLLVLEYFDWGALVNGRSITELSTKV